MLGVEFLAVLDSAEETRPQQEVERVLMQILHPGVHAAAGESLNFYIDTFRKPLLWLSSALKIKVHTLRTQWPKCVDESDFVVKARNSCFCDQNL